jgi:hypothetical protein
MTSTANVALPAQALPSPMQLVRVAVKANLLPGLVLWAALGAFLGAYGLSDTVRDAMAAWAEAKARSGLVFAFLSYVVFAVLLPEALSHHVLGKPAPSREDLLYSAITFGITGMAVDLFYTGQAWWFGEGTDMLTIAKKTLVDQLLFAPFSQCCVLTALLWREEGSWARTTARLRSAEFWMQRVLPLQVALWCIWLPSVMAVYFMPSALQFPVVSVILSFWMLIFKFIHSA